MLLTQSNADSVPLSKTLKTTTEHPFRFFDLPQELRDKIFHLVCTSNPTMISSPYPLAGLSDSDAIRYIRVQYRQQEDSTDANEYQFPAWPLVNRQFFIQAMAQLHRNSSWVVKIPCTDYTTPIYISTGEFRHQCRLNAWHARQHLYNIPLEQQRTNATEDILVEIPEPYNNRRIDMSILKKLQNGSVDPDRRRRIFIQFGVVDVIGRSRLVIDMRPHIHTKSELDEVKIIILVWVDPDDTESQQTVIEALQSEISKVGSTLLKIPLRCQV